jgi:transcriptional regulator with XRE-family HTH domain
MKSSFPERLKMLREKAGWTQEELAKKIKVSDATINRYEKGTRRPDMDILELFADIFGVSVDYLLGRITYQQPSIAAHRTDNIFARDDVPEEARKSVEEFIEFVKKKYKIEE